MTQTWLVLVIRGVPVFLGFVKLYVRMYMYIFRLLHRVQIVYRSTVLCTISSKEILCVTDSDHGSSKSDSSDGIKAKKKKHKSDHQSHKKKSKKNKHHRSHSREKTDDDDSSTAKERRASVESTATSVVIFACQ